MLELDGLACDAVGAGTCAGERRPSSAPEHVIQRVVVTSGRPKYTCVYVDMDEPVKCDETLRGGKGPLAGENPHYKYVGRNTIQPPKQQS